MKHLVAAVLLVGLAASPAKADILQLSFDNGYVTLTANNAPVREILAEWARRGQTRIVNGDRLTSTVTLELPHVPEKQALETLLRSAGGYMAAARLSPTPGLSRFDRIIVMPTAPGNPVRAVAAPVPQQPAPVADPGAMVDDQDDPIQPPGMQPPGFPHPDQPMTDQPATAQPPTMPAPLPAPGIQPMPPQLQPGQAPPGQQVQPGMEDPDDEDTQPPAPGPVPGAQGVLVSPVPGQLPVPAPQPNPR